MTKVVYLVGAGFSAPLGLPVMRDFVVKSKDMLASHPKEFGHFENIFALIKDMNAAKIITAPTYLISKKYFRF
jgi:hypothetical protein